MLPFVLGCATADLPTAQLAPPPALCGDALVGPGAAVQWEVTGVSPGERVVLLRGDAGQSCPAPLNGACLDLDNAVYVTQATADADGVAALSLTLPNAPSLLGREVHLQAVQMLSTGQRVPTNPLTYVLGQPNAAATCAPEGPQVCDPADPGVCECSAEPGFTTYTWDVAGQQRCFTVYVPPSSEPLPTVVAMNCYAQNALGGGGCVRNSPMIRAADAHGFAAVCASATDGNWEFGNDGVVNASIPTPCSESDSKDIRYLQGLLDTLADIGADGTLDFDRIYTSGFSQNAMFAAYAGVCFPGSFEGVWQGGSGLYVDGVTSPLPQSEGACRRSDFLEYGPACQTVAPCTDCEYFPVYPAPAPDPLQSCIMAYEDDGLFETIGPMYDAMTAEGHEPTLLAFADVGRGHAGPLEEWPWIVSCLGVTDTCSDACETQFDACLGATGGDVDVGDFRRCYGGGTYGAVPSCDAGCAPTIGMMRRIEEPCVVDGVCDATETAASCPRDCAPRGARALRGACLTACLPSSR
jgi:hypothetical protein